MKIIKRSGIIVNFNKDKLKKSLIKSGATSELTDNVLQQIENLLYEGITTKQIYRLAFNLLKKSGNGHAARYNLRAALQLLGPDGFFFEKLIARLYAAEAYQSKTNLVLQGKCVNHEVDIMLKKESVITMIECKFHNSREVRSDVKVPMYILSRFNDLRNRTHSIFSTSDTIDSCLICTNSRFTTDAVTFSNCCGLELLSWDYPKKGNIKDKIDQGALYPLTCLTTISIAEKENLMMLDLILVKELINNSDSLSKIGLNENRIKNVLKEASQLCNYIKP